MKKLILLSFSFFILSSCLPPVIDLVDPDDFAIITIENLNENDLVDESTLVQYSTDAPSDTVILAWLNEQEYRIEVVDNQFSLSAVDGFLELPDGEFTLHLRVKRDNAVLADLELILVKNTAGTAIHVYYDANGADSGEAPVDSTGYSEGNSVTVKGNTGNLLKDGFTFAGWNTASNGTGTSYSAGSTLILGATDITLFALWTQNPTYTVTYSANNADSGYVPVDSNNYEEGAIVTVLGNTGNLVRDGYSFLGWSTQSDGGGIQYDPGDMLQMEDSGIILYASWTQNPTYTVVYFGNTADSGDVPIDSNNYEEDETVTVLGNTGSLVKADYRFIGWDTLSGGGGSFYLPGDTFSMSTSIVQLYAVWEPVYTVTYFDDDHDSGSVPIDSYEYIEDETVTVFGNTGNLARTGYSFNGWSTVDGGGGTLYDPEDTFLMGANDITLYAVWDLNSYTVTYHPTTATGGSPPSQEVYYYGAEVTVAGQNTLYKTDANFNGWDTEYGGGGTAYNENDTFNMGTSNVILYAQWEDHTLPTLSTSSISNILKTSATGGGNVTSDGGTSVTARGVCWNTSGNPTTANSKTSNGTGTGSFSSSLTGLTANTTYYVRAYAENSMGTAYGTQVSFRTAVTSVGEYYAGGYVFYVDGTGQHGLVADSTDLSSGVDWGVAGTTGASGTAVGTGENNTNIIAAYYPGGSYAANLCYNSTRGGYSDWFLPSKDELDLIYQNLAKNGIGGYSFPSYYWSSSECAFNEAWGQYFYSTSSGNWYDVNKTVSTYQVRAVREF